MVAATRSGAVWKLVVYGGGAAAAIVTKRSVGRAWRGATGSEPPANPEDPDTTWPEAVAWAMLTGAIGGVIKLLVTRRAAASWRKATGELPPGIAAA